MPSKKPLEKPAAALPKGARGKKLARDYRHGNKALLRPEGGAQDVFPASKRKPPRKMRYDDSLAPEMAWDESRARGEGERLIQAILSAPTLQEAKARAGELKTLSKPFLNWAGKAERDGFSVPTLPLFTHERLSTQAVLQTLKRRHPKRGDTLNLFGESDKSIGDKIAGSYEHLNGWQNRMILGDSLQVMNSLLQYENLGGQVQMVYMDPPYGIRFGSNFMPFVRKRDVKDGDDDSITREPEMVQAFRDTWELGLHSYLTYMRDRLLLTRELLTPSGSCFVQISDENVHHIREIMDEVFGEENFVNIIPFRKKTAPQEITGLTEMFDYLVWYAKNKDSMKQRNLFIARDLRKPGNKYYYRDRDGVREQVDVFALDPKEWNNLYRMGAGIGKRTNRDEYKFNLTVDGKSLHPGSDYGWIEKELGMKNLIAKGRLSGHGMHWICKIYYTDFPYELMSNVWTDVSAAQSPAYVVETDPIVIQRCMLMTTDPGDLVIDPTCGSGATAHVAEKWGRRWITIDVSRVPLAIAREKLLTATYPYYRLKDDKRGPAAGFVYERKQNRKGEEIGGIVPHITLRSIARDEPPAEEVLVDKPETETNTIRITGPFCVEAILPTPLTPDKDELRESDSEAGEEFDHITRMVEVLRQSPELRLPAGTTLKLQKVRPPAKSMNLHAEAEILSEGTPPPPPHQPVVVFSVPPTAPSANAP